MKKKGNTASILVVVFSVLAVIAVFFYLLSPEDRQLLNIGLLFFCTACLLLPKAFGKGKK